MIRRRDSVVCMRREVGEVTVKRATLSGCRGENQEGGSVSVTSLVNDCFDRDTTSGTESESSVMLIVISVSCMLNELPASNATIDTFK